MCRVYICVVGQVRLVPGLGGNENWVKSKLIYPLTTKRATPNDQKLQYNHSNVQEKKDFMHLSLRLVKSRYSRF